VAKQLFLIAVMAMFIIIIGTFFIPSEPPKKEAADRRLDWIGAGIISLSLCLFSFSINQGGLVDRGWKHACTSP